MQNVLITVVIINTILTFFAIVSLHRVQEALRQRSKSVHDVGTGLNVLTLDVGIVMSRLKLIMNMLDTANAEQERKNLEEENAGINSLKNTIAANVKIPEDYNIAAELGETKDDQKETPAKKVSRSSSVAKEEKVKAGNDGNKDTPDKPALPKLKLSL